MSPHASITPSIQDQELLPWQELSSCVYVQIHLAQLKMVMPCILFFCFNPVKLSTFTWSETSLAQFAGVPQSYRLLGNSSRCQGPAEMLSLLEKVNSKRKKSTGRMPYSWEHAELICWHWDGVASSNLKPDLPIFKVSWHSNNAFLSLDGITVDHCLGDLESEIFPLTLKRGSSKIYTFIRIHLSNIHKPLLPMDIKQTWKRLPDPDVSYSLFKLPFLIPFSFSLCWSC